MSIPPSNQPLAGKRILISGGTTGIGRATALLLARRGAQLFIFGRASEPLHHTLDLIRSEGGRAAGACCDVADHSAMEELFAKVEEALGGLDILINNAALPANNIFNTEVQVWEQVLRVNVLGYMLCSRWAVNLMEKQGTGHIVGIGSLCIDVMDSGADVYVASKTAVAGFLGSLRKEVVDRGIKVTLINPGGTSSDMVTESSDEQAAMIADGRLLRPEDVAEAIYYAISQPSQVDVTELTIRPHRQSAL